MLSVVTVFSALLVTASSSFWSSSDPGNYTLVCDEKGPYRCTCPKDDTSSYFDCSMKRIKSLPDDIKFPTLVTDVILTKNQISEISNKIFSSGSKVQHMDLSHNQIAFVASDTFAQLENLNSIDLSHNLIWSLGLGTFRGPRYLQKLNLDYNKINDFFSDIFKDCAALRELSMRYNSIMQLPADSFSFLTALEILDMSNTGLSSLQENVFLNNTKLVQLQLSANSFYSVPTKGLKSAANLEKLDISENPIEQIQPNAFADMKKLTFLKLSHMRRLSTVSRHALAGLDSLKELYITENLMLKTISALAFRKEIPVTTDKSVNEEEDEDEHHKHPTLEKVSFRHNGLEWLPEYLLDWSLLKEVNLMENPWKCDCHLSWIVENKIPSVDKQQAKCKTPSRLAGKSLDSLREADYTCSYLTSEASVALAVVVVAAFLAALAGVGFVMYRRSLLTCRKSTSEPKYSRVVSNKDRVELEWDHTAEPESRA